jgi:hypothetical protein
MAELMYVREADDWEIVSEFSVRTGGVWRQVQEAWVRSEGVWQKFFQALSASASPTSILGTRVGGGLADTNETTCTAEGGTGSYTFVWEIVGQAGDQTAFLNPATGPTTLMQVAFTSGGEQVSGTIRCKVTDTTTGLETFSNNVTFTLAAL